MLVSGHLERKKNGTYINWGLVLGVAQDDALATAGFCSGLWVEQDSHRLDSPTSEFVALELMLRGINL